MRRWVRIAIGLAAACALAVGPVRAEPDAGQGRALFAGERPLHGRILTHNEDLPAAAVRCINCHAVQGSKKPPLSVAPRLTRHGLTEMRRRRGGPPSAYAQDSFCELLRRGEDSAHVLVNVQMPRYAIDDRSCAALWRYLIEAKHD